MTSHDDVPYADPEPLAELIDECRCVQHECAVHGVPLDVEHHQHAQPSPAPVVIGEATRHLVDGLADYGT